MSGTQNPSPKLTPKFVQVLKPEDFKCKFHNYELYMLWFHPFSVFFKILILILIIDDYDVMISTRLSPILNHVLSDLTFTNLILGLVLKTFESYNKTCKKWIICAPKMEKNNKSKDHCVQLLMPTSWNSFTMRCMPISFGILENICRWDDPKILS